MDKQSDVLVEVQQVVKHFPVKGGILLHEVDSVKAVNDVSFQIRRGETFGLVGESGCGKSTLGNILLGLERPTSGTVLYNGTDLYHCGRSTYKQLRQEIQVVFQDPYESLNPRMTVGELVSEGLNIRGGMSKEEKKRRVLEILEQVGLNPEHYSRYPHEFSGGQRQRIGIARALIVEPKFIICDEPVSALDVSVQAQIINLLSDLQKKYDMTYLFIAHGLNVVKYLSDRIGVMYLGQLVEIADSETLFDNPLHPYTQALLQAIPDVDRVGGQFAEKWGDDFGQHVVAAGPFTLGQWNFNQDLTVNAFEDYWAGRPYLDGVKFRVINDENTRIVEFDAGTLDIAWITPAHYDRLTTDPTYADCIGKAYTLHTSFLVFNMEKEPFASNKALREAVLCALDTQAVIDMLQNRASVANTLLPEGMLGAVESTGVPPYDVEKAKALMAEAGYPDGLDGTFGVITPPWNNNIKILEIYQQNLKEIGINIEIEPIENSAYNEAIRSGDFEIAWANIVAGYPDPDAMFYPLFHSDNIGSGGNYARYSNPEVDALLDQARASTDSDERAELYQQADALILEDLPYAYLTHNIYVDICQPYVKNYCPSALDVSMYHRVWLDK